MGLLKTASLAILFGSLYTIFRKYQTIVDLPQENTQFNQPMYQVNNSDFKVSSYLSACVQLLCLGLG
jgi:hypothetical protein